MPPPTHWSQGVDFEFAGVPLVDIGTEAAVRSVTDAIAARQPQGLHLCNAYTLALASRDVAYRELFRHPNAVNLPDGTPVAWFYRLSTHRRAHGPVRGPGLMKAVLTRPGLKHHLLGGSAEVLLDLEAQIAARYPGAEVVGRLSPPFHDPSESELVSWAEQIARSGADIVWVGMGTPRQDLVISRLVGRTPAVLVGVGAAFDFLSGHKSEAPRVLHGTGFEWLFRLATEPRRLWRRYLLGNTAFLAQAARELRGKRQPEPRG